MSAEAKAEEQQSLRWLSSILDILRKECPWDRAQTVESLRYLTLEESSELSEAILEGNNGEMCKELGDLFMHVLFYAKLAEEKGAFTTQDVIDGICRKLTARHPHISLPNREGEMQPATAAQAPQWEQVKMKEGRRSVLEGVPASLPALLKCVRMQEKAAGTGYEFRSRQEAFAKVQEEYEELREALVQQDEVKAQHAVAATDSQTNQTPRGEEPLQACAGQKDTRQETPRQEEIRQGDNLRELSRQENTVQKDTLREGIRQGYTRQELSRHEETGQAALRRAQSHVEEEFGDLLFILVKWGRWIGVNADDALSKANQKFYRRFTYMEQAALQQGHSLPQLTKEEMLALWRDAKQHGL